MWLFKTKLKFVKIKNSVLATLAAFPRSNSHMWLMATIIEKVRPRTFPSLLKVLLNGKFLIIIKLVVVKTSP